MARPAKKKDSQDGYIRVSLPEDLIKLIDEFIEESKGKFRYRNEVIRHAVIDFIEKERRKRVATAKA